MPQPTLEIPKSISKIFPIEHAPNTYFANFDINKTNTHLYIIYVTIMLYLYTILNHFFC